jgi:hypothetical protein
MRAEIEARAAARGHPWLSFFSPDDAPHFGKSADVTMLALTGGLERTEAEYRALLASAGFVLTRVIPTESHASVLEGRRA